MSVFILSQAIVSRIVVLRNRRLPFRLHYLRVGGITIDVVPAAR